MKRPFLILAIAIWAVLASGAGAVTISVHNYDKNFTADTLIDGSSSWVYIGAFRLNISGYAQPQEAWCVDLKQIVSSTWWNATQKSTLPTALDDGRRADLAMGALWTNRPAATDARGRAALQLAIWEALYDGFGSDPFTTGRFRVTNVYQGTNRSLIDSLTLTLASNYLHAWGGIGILNGTLFDAPLPGPGTRSQDFILTPGSGFDPLVVPEPGTMALMAFGLLAVGRLVRRHT